MLLLRSFIHFWFVFFCFPFWLRLLTGNFTYLIQMYYYTDGIYNPKISIYKKCNAWYAIMCPISSWIGRKKCFYIVLQKQPNLLNFFCHTLVLHKKIYTQKCSFHHLFHKFRSYNPCCNFYHSFFHKNTRNNLIKSVKNP